ncbi:MAG: hypothetical protein JWQ77_2218 [Jatrophihabitans sp.]|nr:hypothetical protein [Jatrophihabitans sp.]
MLDQPTPDPSATEQLRSALADPALEIVFRHSSTGTWIDELGLPVLQAVLDSGRSVTTLERDGDWVAALLHDPLLDPTRLEDACAAAAARIDDERLKAELRAQVRDEQASRARIVAASDRQRRLFERNLHDGAQQRLVGLALMLRLAGNRVGDERSITALLGEAVAELDEAIQDLRELARGLHPAIVTDAGLVAAIESLAEHPGIPVELALELPDRLPERVEVGAYYLVAETIANANKHSSAELISVRAAVVGGTLHVSVSDDGSGVAEISGSGLVGLEDRLGSLGGYLVVDSEPDLGTTVAGFIPLRAPTAAARHLVDDILLRVVPEDDGVGPFVAGTARHARWIRGDQDRRRRALKWIAWQNHTAPGEIVEAQPEAEDLEHAKALLLIVGGNTKISTQRRDWLLGYLTACGYSETTLAAAAAYDDSDRLEDILRPPRMALARLVLLYDALRAVAMDRTEFAPSDFDPVLRAADVIGVSREIVADLHEIVIEEARLRQRRHRIVVAPAMPKLINDSIAAIRDASSETGG